MIGFVVGGVVVGIEVVGKVIGNIDVVGWCVGLVKLWLNGGVV